MLTKKPVLKTEKEAYANLKRHCKHLSDEKFFNLYSSARCTYRLADFFKGKVEILHAYVYKDLDIVSNPTKNFCGLCHILSRGDELKYYGIVRNVLFDVFPYWRYFSGVTPYPVPSTKEAILIDELGIRSKPAFHKNKSVGNMAKGEYGQLRLDLAKFLLAYFHYLWAISTKSTTEENNNE